MGKAKLELNFAGFKEYAEKLDELNGDLKAVAEKALQNTHDFITPKLHADMRKHKRTGITEKSIVDNAKVQWEGSVASIDVGFNVHDGGLASIFLMYGTPRMPKDQQLYDDIYGAKTKKQVRELQEKTFTRAIQKAMGG